MYAADIWVAQFLLQPLYFWKGKEGQLSRFFPGCKKEGVNAGQVGVSCIRGQKKMSSAACSA